jgi:hypothetical protein
VSPEFNSGERTGEGEDTYVDFGSDEFLFVIFGAFFRPKINLRKIENRARAHAAYLSQAYRLLHVRLQLRYIFGLYRPCPETIRRGTSRDKFSGEGGDSRGKPSGGNPRDEFAVEMGDPRGKPSGGNPRDKFSGEGGDWREGLR